jgi:hypothetical protein
VIVAEIARALSLYYTKSLDDAGRAVGSQARYVGGTLWECCAPGVNGKAAGTLRVSMAGMGPSQQPPNRQHYWGTCAAMQVVEWQVRVARCWPADEHSTPEEFDVAAAGVMDDAWVMAMASLELLNNPELLDGLCEGSLGCKLGGYSLVPILPQGGCAGNMVTIFSSARGPHSLIAP